MGGDELVFLPQRPRGPARPRFASEQRNLCTPCPAFTPCGLNFTVGGPIFAAGVKPGQLRFAGT
eukprot:1852665-Rhodomonas_salina.1